MKYLLINKQTAEETLCDKVTIDGFDYYVCNKKPSIGDKSFLQGQGVDPIILTHFRNCEISHEGKKVIATNNPNLDIPQVVDEVEILTFQEFKNWSFGEHGPWDPYKMFQKGYNKSQETHSFSDEDMVEFYEWCDTSAEANLFWRRNRIELDMNGKHHEIIKQKRKELLQLWKEQQTKKIYYTQTTTK